MVVQQMIELQRHMFDCFNNHQNDQRSMRMLAMTPLSLLNGIKSKNSLVDYFIILIIFAGLGVWRNCNLIYLELNQNVSITHSILIWQWHCLWLNPFFLPLLVSTVNCVFNKTYIICFSKRFGFCLWKKREFSLY